MDIFTANKIMEIALRTIYENASTLDEADELARAALDHAADYHAAQANRGPLPAAEPLGYIAASKVEEMQREFKDSRIAGTGVMVTKDPAEGRVAVYLAPQPAQGVNLKGGQYYVFDPVTKTGRLMSGKPGPMPFCMELEDEPETLVTQESALAAIEHVNQSNSHGREREAIKMLVHVSPTPTAAK